MYVLLHPLSMYHYWRVNHYSVHTHTRCGKLLMNSAANITTTTTALSKQTEINSLFHLAVYKNIDSIVKMYLQFPLQFLHITKLTRCLNAGHCYTNSNLSTILSRFSKSWLEKKPRRNTQLAREIKSLPAQGVLYGGPLTNWRWFMVPSLRSESQGLRWKQTAF